MKAPVVEDSTMLLSGPMQRLQVVEVFDGRAMQVSTQDLPNISQNIRWH